MGEYLWKFLLHAINAIDTKVTKCLWTDCDSKGIKNKIFGKRGKSVADVTG
jgi:hypothetical protein